MCDTFRIVCDEEQVGNLTCAQEQFQSYAIHKLYSSIVLYSLRETLATCDYGASVVLLCILI